MPCMKVGYASKSDAVEDAKRIRMEQRNSCKLRKKDGKKLRPYMCPRCGDWHLTTEKHRKQVKRSKRLATITR